MTQVLAEATFIRVINRSVFRVVSIFIALLPGIRTLYRQEDNAGHYDNNQVEG